MTDNYYRLIDHTADLGLEIFGADEKQLFTHAALALFDMIADGPLPAGRHQRTVVVAGDDWPDLMVNWLRELLYMWNGEGQLIDSVTIEELTQSRMCATVTSDDYAPGRHSIRNEIKAVTYHQIQVGPHQACWRARVIFDV